MESWMLGPPLLIGEKVFYTKHGFVLSGTVKWLGRLQEAFGNQMATGIILVSNRVVLFLCKRKQQKRRKFNIQWYSMYTKVLEHFLFMAGRP